MSKHSFKPEEPITINVVPSFGQITPVNQETQRLILNHIQQAKRTHRVLHERPADFDPSRYASFSIRESVEDPVPEENFQNYMTKSRLRERLGF